VKANIEIVVDRLKSLQLILVKLVKDEKLKIFGAYYDLDTGLVNILL
jgi:carbonic anhydrase